MLFNLGVSHYASGCAAEKAGGQEGVKQASASFQAAAGVFAELKAVVPRSVAGVTADLTAECASALETLSLARAQEAFYEAAITGGRSAALCSKLAAGAASLYGDAMKAFSAQPLRDALDKTWHPTAAIRAALMHAKAAQHVAAGHAAAQSGTEKAQEAARLGSAVAALRNALRIARGVLPEPALGPVAAMEASVKQKLSAAEKECDVVFMVRVPAPESLPPVPVMMGVKSTPLGPLIDAGKETLLRTIVPDTAARSLSRYSDMVDALIREAATALADASDQARTRLRELELPELVDAIDRGGPVPGPLLDECAEVTRTGGVSALMQQLPRLQDLSRGCAAALATASATLAAVEHDEAGPPGSSGSTGSAPAPDALVAGVREKIRGYETTLVQAQHSDGVLVSRVQASEPRLSTLDPSAVVSGAPRLMPPLTPVGGDAATAPALRATLRALEENAVERAGIEEDLKALKHSDDILPRIMAAGGTDGVDAVFAAELQKYDPPKAAATANVAACTALLARLSAQHAAFSTAHDVVSYKHRLAVYCSDLRDALRVWRDLSSAVAEGLNFYTQLRAHAAAVADEAAGVAGARRAAAEERMRDAARREAQAAQSRADAERAAAIAAVEREQAAAARAQAEAQTAAWMAQQEQARQAQAQAQAAHATALAHHMQAQATLRQSAPPQAAPPAAQQQQQHVWTPSVAAAQAPPPAAAMYYQQLQPPVVHAHAAAAAAPQYYQQQQPPPPPPQMQPPPPGVHGYAPPPGAWPQGVPPASGYYPAVQPR